MLFNSYGFIFAFLPLTFVLYLVLGPRLPRRAALGWLVLCSLFFYGWWNPAYLSLLVFSIVFNFFMGQAAGGRFSHSAAARKAGAIVGIAVNLGLLGYFKYANFFFDQIQSLFPFRFEMAPIFLPLAISFFTFQQIAFLVDSYRGVAHEYHFVDYCLFVSFFPQLIAGPIVHHQEMMPQFATADRRFDPFAIATGLSYFVIGLFKKVFLADNLARYATPVFDMAQSGESLTLVEAWGGVLAYTFQIYFDFSGYSDMAIGLAWMIGIRLPVNFNSPYKAGNIIEFWRRWHITLSRFLRDYLYIPLGGNRHGSGRRYANIMITMLLGGLWHGAGWTFVIWGGLHGFYLAINHGWQFLRSRRKHQHHRDQAHPAGIVLTFLAVVVAWVFFRAESPAAVSRILEGMAGLNGISLSDNLASSLQFLTRWGITFNDTGAFDSHGLRWIVGGALIVFFAPNSQEFMRRENWVQAKGFAGRFPGWHPRFACAAGVAILAVLALLRLGEVSEFLYFQF
jgi:D-alanyl-lipoteichoic acid acyltransferase DltB (MBOAT superfamily)